MIFYFSGWITARAFRSRAETVNCEKCGARYRYLLIRAAKATATASYGLGVQSALNRARNEADGKAAKLLATGVDPVACPDCGWFQPAMVTEICQRRTAWLNSAAIGSAAVLALIAVVDFMIQTRGLKHGFDHMSGGEILGIVASAAAVVLVPAALWACRWFTQSRLQPNDPNADHSIETRDAPACARVGPDGQNDAALGSEPIETTAPGQLGYERGYGEKFPGGWMTVQLASLASPPVCSICLEPCQSTRLIGPLKIPIAVCPSCKSRSMRSGLLVGVAVLGIFIAAAGAIIVPMSNRVREEKGVLIVVLSVICATAVLVVINRLTQPMRCRRISVERNTVALRFSRRPFAEEFFSLNRQRARMLLDQQSTPMATPASDGHHVHRI